tara:strand:+ start:794 stop:2053 length:1260 start_codon:yes stop_codon:yes gene_type:complete
MAQFDDLVAKYRNLTYGRLASNNPSAIKSLLETTDKSISNPQYFGNIDPRQQQYLDTPSGLIAQNRFRIDPQTGIPIFETPASESIKSASGTYDPNIDYGDPGYAGVIPVDPLIGIDPVPTFASPERGGGGQRLPTGRDILSYQNPDYKGLVGGDFKDTNVGDKFSFSKDLPYGKAYDEYGRVRNIGDTLPGAIQYGINTIGDFFTSGGIIGSLFKDKEEDKDDKPAPTPFDSGYESSYDPNKPGSGGYNKKDSSYKGSSSIDRDPGGKDFGKPSSGPSGDDKSTGKDSGMPPGDDASGDKPRDGGNPGGNPSKKIVCTMMNESYGFGSFRNAIWLKYAKDNLSPEYQIGYHKLFLPLVKYAKGNNKSNLLVKNILEHIAIHRTIDLKQQMRNNKRHTLGRIYRAILEPLCFIVGKYGK